MTEEGYAFLHAGDRFGMYKKSCVTVLISSCNHKKMLAVDSGNTRNQPLGED